jgi:site-specific DNA recombinase
VIAQWADANGHEVIGWAEDLDVSGAVAPWAREGLGLWLPSTIGNPVAGAAERAMARDASRAAEWDVMASWKLDRVSRNVVHVHQLHEWMQGEGKSLVSVSDGIDTGTKMGGILFGLLATFAQAELETMRERARASFAHLVKVGRWRGGVPPYGYRPEPMADGKGYRLVVDDATAEHLRDIVRRVLDGTSVNALVAELNTEGMPTPMDAHRIRNGKEPNGYKWRFGALVKMLRSPTLLGQQVLDYPKSRARGGDEVQDHSRHALRVAVGEDGLPVQRAEPLLDRETWERLQAVLDERGWEPVKAAAGRKDRALLLRVLFCECGEAMYTYRGRNARYYRCSSKSIGGVSCGRGAIPKDATDAEVTEHFLRAVGDLEAIDRVKVPGVDYSREIADLEAALGRLEGDRDAGLYDGPTAAERYRAQHRKHTSAVDELRARPVTAETWREERTGETYRDRWGRLDTDQDRNRELREAGLRVVAYPEALSPAAERFSMRLHEPDDEGSTPTASIRRGRLGIHYPADLEERIRKHILTRGETR